jgi:MOSC domain-containing protein YiiM/GNAT superfamily N-acetyltransferase
MATTLERTTDILPTAVGRVYQVNVSPGGLPKLPVDEARVGPLGLDGDDHHERTVHGGPYRAVCLFAMEAIERLQAEGHPTEPGGVGENLTTIGVEWSTLAAGTRVRVGDQVLLELTSPAMPCSTQRPNFLGGRFARISILTHPSDSRMYARVLADGTIRAGDPITLLPPEPDSLGERAVLMARLDRVEQESNLRLWNAAIAGGYAVHVLDDGELSVAASPTIPGPAFNSAVGLRTLPHLLPMALDHFRANGVTGWLPMHEAPWSGAEPEFQLSILAAPPTAIDEQAAPPGVTIRQLRPDEHETWSGVLDGGEAGVFPADVTSAISPHLLATRDVHAVAAFDAVGRAIGVGSLHVHRRVGLLRAGVVLPEARGRGLQRAMIAARAELAAELGCDMLTSQAAPGTISEGNLLRSGMERILVRDVYRYDSPAG